MYKQKYDNQVMNETISSFFNALEIANKLQKPVENKRSSSFSEDDSLDNFLNLKRNE